MNAMDALSMSKAECRNVYLQDGGEPYDKIVIGAVIPKRVLGGSPEILIMKRAADEKFLPNVLEIPGGKVEDIDRTVLDAVKREVSEETGMEVKKVIGAIKPFSYAAERKITKADGGELNVWSSTLQLNFVCEVAKHDLVVNPEEHSEGKFINRSELEETDLTEQMRAVVEDAFEWVEADSSSVPVLAS
ncbi:MAG: hypothetical protein Q9216_006375 [Gyalolechia sp. 2 TL-2023]